MIPIAVKKIENSVIFLSKIFIVKYRIMMMSFWISRSDFFLYDFSFFISVFLSPSFHLPIGQGFLFEILFGQK